MTEREITHIDIAIRGDEPQLVGRHRMRPVTFAAMLVLQKLGSPMAGIGNGGGLIMTDMQLAEVIWVLAAPWEQVRDISLQCTAEDKSPAERAVLDFAANLSPAELESMVALLNGYTDQANAVAAEVLPDDNATPSKN
jgi:hypothetical protein